MSRNSRKSRADGNRKGHTHEKTEKWRRRGRGRKRRGKERRRMGEEEVEEGKRKRKW